MVSLVKLAMGDLVLLSVKNFNVLDKVTKKFFHLFEGPYQITKAIGYNAFVLANPNNSEEVIWYVSTYPRWVKVIADGHNGLRKVYETKRRGERCR